MRHPGGWVSAGLQRHCKDLSGYMRLLMAINAITLGSVGNSCDSLWNFRDLWTC